jgi:hypothetical protein
MALVPNARRLFWRLWSIRLALFWGAVCGLYAAWPAFMEMVSPPIFAAASVLMSMAIVGARVLKQPGISYDD